MPPSELAGRRPDFLIIGSQKAGTTSLYHALRLHPEVFVPEKKELNFFFLEDEYARGLDYYARYFEPAPAGIKAVGEASPGYICHPETPARIAAALPDAKLVLTVRNPIDRACRNIGTAGGSLPSRAAGRRRWTRWRTAACSGRGSAAT